MDDENFNILNIGEIIDKERLPFGLPDTGNIAQCAIQLNAWIKGRGLPDTRKDINKIKNLFRVNDKTELIVKSYGLNLTDHYWVHKTEELPKWEQVNYFDNVFDEVKQKGNYDPVIDKSVNSPSPNFCVDGSIEKRWVIIDGERFLLKGSRYAVMQEPFNEMIASLIMDEFGVEHVNYRLKRTGEGIPYSECKTMSDRTVEFINAQWVINKEYSGTKELYEHFIEICGKNGISGVKGKLDSMIALDFLMGNEDRHRGNFGILRNADTLEWVDIAPLFDNGNSLFFDRGNEDINNWGIDSLGKAFGDSNRLQLNVINNPDWYSSGKGNKLVDIVEYGLKLNEKLLSGRIEKTIEITKKRKDVFEGVLKNKQR